MAYIENERLSLIFLEMINRKYMEAFGKEPHFDLTMGQTRTLKIDYIKRENLSEEESAKIEPDEWRNIIAGNATHIIYDALKDSDLVIKPIDDNIIRIVLPKSDFENFYKKWFKED